MIIVIIGPTACGKTKMSIELAKHLNAEVINADAVQVYKDVNIGTAKTTKEEMEGIHHHLIDYVSLDKKYTIYDYQKEGREVLDNLIKQDKNIIVVGGSGLYIKSLLYDYNLEEEIKRENNYEELYNYIDGRVDKMIDSGLLEEAEYLYNKNINTNSIIGYKELNEYFNDKVSLEEAINNIKKNTRHYAKRQLTWFNNQFKDKIEIHVDYNNFSKTIEEALKVI